MTAPNSHVFFPSGFQELFATWSRLNDAVLCAGGLEQIRYQGNRLPAFPRNLISLDKMKELGKISRSERYLELGATVKLSQIIHLGKIVPAALARCLEHIAGPALRNMATIGGNICNPSGRLDASAPMIALDAQYELRTAQSTRWISASRFSPLPGPPILGSQEILTRIRVPLEPWSFTCYRKFTTHGSNKPGGAILFILRNQKSVLTDIRVVYSGRIILREKNSETMLAGKRLPLDRRDAAAFTESWKTYLSLLDDPENPAFPEEGADSRSDLMKAQILNFIETSIMRISE